MAKYSRKDARPQSRAAIFEPPDDACWAYQFPVASRITTTTPFPNEALPRPPNRSKASQIRPASAPNRPRSFDCADSRQGEHPLSRWNIAPSVRGPGDSRFRPQTRRRRFVEQLAAEANFSQYVFSSHRLITQAAVNEFRFSLPEALLREAKKDLRCDGLKDALQIGRGRRKHCLSHGLSGIERGARRIVSDLLQKRLADLVPRPIE